MDWPPLLLKGIMLLKVFIEPVPRDQFFSHHGNAISFNTASPVGQLNFYTKVFLTRCQLFPSWWERKRKVISVVLDLDSIRGQIRGKQHRGLRTKALMRDLGTRLECRHRVFVRTEKTLWTFTLGKKFDSCPAGLKPVTYTLRLIAYDYPTAPSPRHDFLLVRLWFLSLTDVPNVYYHYYYYI